MMVFYHGGGWVIGDLDTHDGWCAEAARQLDMPVDRGRLSPCARTPLPRRADRLRGGDALGRGQYPVHGTGTRR
jgi:hypothetical protein